MRAVLLLRGRGLVKCVLYSGDDSQILIHKTNVHHKSRIHPSSCAEMYMYTQPATVNPLIAELIDGAGLIKSTSAFRQ